MSEIFVAALPIYNSEVNEISSEQLPHMTLLLLDDSKTDTLHILDYIQHVVNTSLTKFWLHISKRGLLGKDDADVIFFDQQSAQYISKVREYMLKDPMVKTAYDSIEQFPEWTPHLTLGYPETPANDKGLDDTWVEFDRIYIAIDGNEVTTIDLKEMSMAQFYQDAFANAGANFLAHVGVKGMKWGVRKREPDTTHWSSDAKSAHATRVKSKTTGHKSLTNQEIQTYLQRLSLEKQFIETTPSGKASKFIRELMLGVGKQNVNKVMGETMNIATTKGLGKLKK